MISTGEWWLRVWFLENEEVERLLVGQTVSVRVVPS